ncbi:thioesterase II family protein [Streptomyces sp. NPDC001070]
MITQLSARWLVSGPSRPAAPKLYCFAHGGGSAAEYVRWARTLTGAELHVVQLPGRGSRFAEPPLTSMDALVTALAGQVAFGAPYTFFGHSLGALVAYELTAALRDAGRRPPERLVVSGFPAPHLPRTSRGLHRLPDDELLAEVSRLHGGIPQEVLAEPEMRALVAVPLRADYMIVETYEWRDRAPLAVPVTVLGGRDDRVSPAELAAWQELTTAPVDVRTFPGGHFYLREHPAAVLRALAGLLRTTPC